MTKYKIIDNSSYIIDAEKTYFTPESILNFTSEISHKLSVQTEDSNDCVSIRIQSRDRDINDDIAKKLVQSLVDHQVRLNLQKENGHIRDMIVEQAFSSTRK